MWLDSTMQIHLSCSNFFFPREFQLIASTFDDNILLSDQDTNRFLNLSCSNFIWGVEGDLYSYRDDTPNI